MTIKRPSGLYLNLSGRLRPLFGTFRKAQAFIWTFQEGSGLYLDLSGRLSPLFGPFRKAQVFSLTFQEGSALYLDLTGRFILANPLFPSTHLHTTILKAIFWRGFFMFNILDPLCQRIKRNNAFSMHNKDGNTLAQAHLLINKSLCPYLPWYGSWFHHYWQHT